MDSAGDVSDFVGWGMAVDSAQAEVRPCKVHGLGDQLINPLTDRVSGLDLGSSIEQVDEPEPSGGFSRVTNPSLTMRVRISIGRLKGRLKVKVRATEVPLRLVI